MHKLNILVTGSDIFKTTLNELKPFLKFKFFFTQKNSSNKVFNSFDGLISDEDKIDREIIVDDTKCFKILASKDKNVSKFFDYILKLPTSVKEINDIIEAGAAKKKFSKNSSIKIKNYLLDKNEKKLLKNDIFVILTEKEIQLLELFLSNQKPITKNMILSLVWNYSSEADTHTVETHIYRLRKKISDKFSDEKFILNNRHGYYL